MDVVDEEVHPDIKFKFFLALEQREQLHELLSLALLEETQKFLLVIFGSNVVVVIGSLNSSV